MSFFTWKRGKYNERGRGWNTLWVKYAHRHGNGSWPRQITSEFVVVCWKIISQCSDIPRPNKRRLSLFSRVKTNSNRRRQTPTGVSNKLQQTSLLAFVCVVWIGLKTNYFRNYLRWKESAGTLKMMDWPPQSLDLNPIELIWGELENKLDRSIVHSKESLWLELQNNISVEVLKEI